MKPKQTLTDRGITMYYKYFYTIVSHNLVGPLFYIVLLALETIQLVYYPFKLLFHTELSTGLFHKVYLILSAPNIESYAINYKFSTLLIINCLLLGIFLIIFLTQIICLCKTSDSLYQHPIWMGKLLSVIYILYQLYLLKPIMAFHVAIFRCKSSVFESEIGIKCWEGNHMLAIIAVCVSFLIQVFNISVVTTLFIDECPLSKICWSSTQDAFPRYLKYIYKLAIVSFEMLDNKGKYINITLLILCAISGFILYLRLFSSPPINVHVGRAQLFTDVIVFTWALLSYVLITIETADLYSYLTVLFSFLSSISLASAIIYIKQIIEKNKLLKCLKEVEEDEDVEYLYSILFRILEYSIKGSIPHTMQLYGIVKQHQLSCEESKEEGCFCTEFILSKEPAIEDENKEETKLNLKIETHKKLEIGVMFSINTRETTSRRTVEDSNNIRLIQFFIESIKKGIEDNPNSMIYRMLNSYIHKCFTTNYLKAIYDIMYICKVLKPGIKKRFQLHLLKQTIEDEIKATCKNQAKCINPESFIAFDENYTLMRNEADAFSNGVYRFWQQACLSTADANEMAMLSSIISQSLNNIEMYYQTCTQYKPHDLYLLKFMRDTHSMLLNNDKESQLLSVQIEQLQREVSNLDDLDRLLLNQDSESLMVVVSGNPGTIGKIINCNAKIDMLGFKSLDLLNENISLIIPSYIATKHVELIERFISNNSQSFMIGQFRIIHALTAQKYVITMRIIITCIQTLQNGINFFALLRPLESTKMYFVGKEHLFQENKFGVFITNYEGALQGISKICITDMGFPVDLFNEKSSHEESTLISTLIQDLKEEGVEKELENEGKILTIDTRLFQRVNAKDNSDTHKEGIFKIFLKLFHEECGNSLIKVKIWRFLLLEQLELSSEKLVDEISEKSNKENSKLKKVFSKLYSRVLPNPIETSMNPITVEPSNQIHKKEEIASQPDISNETQLIDDRSIKKSLIKDLHTMVCKRLNIGHTLLVVATIVFSVIMLALVWISKSSIKKEFSIHFSMIQREADIAFIVSDAYQMMLMGVKELNSIFFDTNYHYQLLSSIMGTIVDNLRSTQDNISKSDFISDSSTYLETAQCIKVINLDNSGNEQVDYHSINTAITQFISKVVNINSVTYENALSHSDLILSSLQFIVSNGLGNLSQTLNASRVANIEGFLYKYSFLNYPALCLLLVWLCSALTISIVLLNKIIRIKRNKVAVLALFFQIPIKEIEQHITSCNNYILQYNFIKEKMDDMQFRENNNTDVVSQNSTPSSKLKKHLSLVNNIQKIASLHINLLPVIEEPVQNEIENIKEENDEDYIYYSEDEEEGEEKENENSPLNEEALQEEDKDEIERNQLILQNFAKQDSSEKEINARIPEQQLGDQLTVKKRVIIVGMIISYLLVTVFAMASFLGYQVYKSNCIKLYGMQSSLSLYSVYPSIIINYLSEYLNGVEYYNLQNESQLDASLEVMDRTEQEIDHYFLHNSKYIKEVTQILSDVNNNHSCDAYNQHIIRYIQQINNTSLLEGFKNNSCSTKADGMADKGSKNLHYSIAHEVQSLYFKKNEGTAYDTHQLWNLSMVQQLYDGFVFYSMEQAVQNKVSSITSELEQLVVWSFIVSIVVLVLLRGVVWRMHMRSIENEVFMSVGMLSILPCKYISSHELAQKLK